MVFDGVIGLQRESDSREIRCNPVLRDRETRTSASSHKFHSHPRSSNLAGEGWPLTRTTVTILFWAIGKNTRYRAPLPPAEPERNTGYKAETLPKLALRELRLDSGSDGYKHCGEAIARTAKCS
ncbi:hypothetical protein LENED_009354 [Lentinula edodes]|uniref:Uncharacterized protein n=1 Tax=Lentinula edodes TaxID=5353 RepID=A0A1Q3EJG5_LENED|nr:hypothetical protein LENED_009354 [Lentinula edodes]